MTNAEITNRKSKILEVSSIKQMQMKVGKENLPGEIKSINKVSGKTKPNIKK